MRYCDNAFLSCNFNIIYFHGSIIFPTVNVKKFMLNKVKGIWWGLSFVRAEMISGTKINMRKSLTWRSSCPWIRECYKLTRKQVILQLLIHLQRSSYSFDWTRILLQRGWSLQITRKSSSNSDLLPIVAFQRVPLGSQFHVSNICRERKIFRKYVPSTWGDLFARGWLEPNLEAQLDKPQWNLHFWLFEKDSGTGKDWRQKEKGEPED